MTRNNVILVQLYTYVDDHAGFRATVPLIGGYIDVIGFRCVQWHPVIICIYWRCSSFGMGTN